MADSDVLLTIAEVAVAFAGFASLVGILGRRTSRDDPRVLGVRMRAMTVFSLMAVGFALVPFIFAGFGIRETTAWRASSGLFLAAMVLVLRWIVLWIRGLRQAGVSQRRSVPRIATMLFSSMGGALVVLSVNVLGLAPSLLPTLYLLGLAIVLFLAGFAFSLILFSFLPPLEPEAAPEEAPQADDG